MKHWLRRPAQPIARRHPPRQGRVLRPLVHKFNGECRNDHHTTLAQKREAGGLPGGGA